MIDHAQCMHALMLYASARQKVEAARLEPLSTRERKAIVKALEPMKAALQAFPEWCVTPRLDIGRELHSLCNRALNEHMRD